MILMATPNPRTIRQKQPAGLIAVAIAAGVLLLGGIFFATWQSGEKILDAKMRGIVVNKEFVPAPEEQITIGEGGVRAQDTAGEYILTVRVPGKDGASKDYNVWLDKTRYDATGIGDSFDVGPYLVPDKP